jgi:hypothetical protein
MSVPSIFTLSEIAQTFQFMLIRLSDCFVNDKGDIRGNPFVTYKEIAENLGYTLDDEWDGDRVGILAAMVAEQQIALGKPLMSCLVVRAPNRIDEEQGKMVSPIPGHGFYVYAAQVGLFPKRAHYDIEGIEELAFWRKQVEACIREWGKK